MKVLFVTWDGPQVFYLESLFLPIFRRLSEQGWEFHVFQFTWGDDARRHGIRETCEREGVPYRSARVWRRPASLGALLTAFRGGGEILRAVHNWNIEILMPRSTLPLLACMQVWRRNRLPIVFDADGLPLDERVDFAGMAPSGFAYRFLRDVEAQGVRRASAVLTRTSKAADILLARAGSGTSRSRFYQVSNGRDIKRFGIFDTEARAHIRTKIDVDCKAPLLVYAGSLGEQYCLPEMLSLFSKILERRADARFLVLTASPEMAQLQVAAHLDLKNKVVIRSVPPADVPAYLASADVGLALRRATFSMQGVAPIKLGEYLLCGLPVIATGGVGDTSSIAGAGFLIDQREDCALAEAATWFMDEVLPERESFRTRCRELGMAHHSLEASVDSYRRALESIGS